MFNLTEGSLNGVQAAGVFNQAGQMNGAQISLVNVVLVVAWLVPDTALVIAACFVISYLYSFGFGGVTWLKHAKPQTS